MSFLAKLLLTGTAAAPVLLVYAATAAFECLMVSALVLTLIALALLIACLLLLRHVRRHLEAMHLSITSIQPADRDSFGLIVLYLVPLLRLRFSELTWHILIPSIGIFLALMITDNNYHFNPLLKALKWHFYKVGTDEGVTYLLITKKSPSNAKDTLNVGYLTRYTAIDLD